MDDFSPQPESLFQQYWAILPHNGVVVFQSIWIVDGGNDLLIHSFITYQPNYSEGFGNRILKEPDENMILFV